MSTPEADVIPPALAKRPLLDDTEVAELSGLFGVLANETRLRILHAIARSGSPSVGDLADEVGASNQAVSNHLQRMADLGMVASRREGNRVHYRLIDPCVGGVMELGLCLLGHEPDDRC